MKYSSIVAGARSSSSAIRPLCAGAQLPAPSAGSWGDASHHTYLPMRKVLVVSFITCFAAVSAMAQSGDPTNSATAGMPRLVLTSTNSLDFGRVIAGAIVRHDFAYSNAGSATLKIERVEPSCDCTVVTNWSRSLAPGTAGTVSVEYHSSAGFRGEAHQSVRLLSNDPQQPETKLFLGGIVWQPIEVNPPSAVFHISPEAKTNMSHGIRIRNADAAPLFLSQPESNSKWFRAQIRTNTLGKDYEVLVVTAGTPNVGTTEGVIALKTTSTNLPLLSIPVTAMVPAGLVVTPASLTLPAGPMTKETSLRVSMRNNRSEPVTVKSATANIAGARVEVKEVQPGRLFYLTVFFPPGFELKADQKVGLEVVTTSAEFPKLLIPVYTTDCIPANGR